MHKRNFLLSSAYALVTFRVFFGQLINQVDKNNSDDTFYSFLSSTLWQDFVLKSNIAQDTKFSSYL
jgi:hypothetical protein